MPRARFTSFSTYQDMVRMIDCMEKGGTYNQCLAVGDSGRGASGSVTAQEHTAMVALPHCPEPFGRKVKLTLDNGRSCIAEYADTSPAGICDCNPATLKALCYPTDTELDEQGEWEWVE